MSTAWRARSYRLRVEVGLPTNSTRGRSGGSPRWRRASACGMRRNCSRSRPEGITWGCASWCRNALRCAATTMVASARRATPRQAPSRITQDALEIVAPEGDDQGQALGQGQEPALTELGVDQVVALAAQAALHVEPGRRVAHGLPAAVEPKHIHVHAG